MSDATDKANLQRSSDFIRTINRKKKASIYSIR